MLSSSGKRRAGPGAPALWIGAAVAGVIGTLLVLAGTRAFAPHRPPPSLRRFVLAETRSSPEFEVVVRISPDGRYVLYSSGNHLVVRDLGQLAPADVPGSEGATSAFWSPDSRRIAYLKPGGLWTSEPTGAGAAAVPAKIADLDLRDGDWGADGTLVVARRLGGLYLVPVSGGDPRLLLGPDSTEVEIRHPQFLPDGRHIVAVARRVSGRHAVVLVSYPEGVRRNLGEFEKLDAVRYSPTGQILLSFEGEPGAVMAVSFSRSGLTIAGEPFLVAAGGRGPSVSADGSLAYVSRAAGDSTSVLVLAQNWATDLAGGTKGR